MLRVNLVQSLMEQGCSGESEALEQLVEAEKATPSDPDVFFLRGKIYFSQGHYEDAVAANSTRYRFATVFRDLPLSTCSGVPAIREGSPGDGTPPHKGASGA